MPSSPSRQRAGRRDFAVVIVAALSLTAFVGGASRAADDPLEWRAPAQKTQFRKVLADADYRRLSAPIASRLAQARKEAASKLPDHGLKISGVFLPGALEVLGVTMNDVIVKVDSEELWGRYAERGEAPVRVRVYSAAQNGFRDLKVTTELSLAFSVYRRPDLAYLRSGARNAAWDGDAFVGLVAAPSAPDLAETAWHRALAAGCPRNRSCLASGAKLALAQGRPEVALDFWYEAEHNGEPEPLDPLLGYRVLIANYKIEQARDLVRRHPKLFPNVEEGLETLVALHRARSPQERAAPSPSVQARGMHRRDARADLIGLSPLAENTFLYQLTNRNDFRADVESDHYAIVELQTPQRLGDFELRLALTMQPTDKRRAGFVKLARLSMGGFRKMEGPEHGESGLVTHVELEVPSGFSLRNSETAAEINYPDPLIASDGKGQNTVRVLRVGGQMEIFINERRVLYQPIHPELKLQDIHFQVVGVSVNVTEFALDELIPRL
jgi:hypothetical protein